MNPAPSHEPTWDTLVQVRSYNSSRFGKYVEVMMSGEDLIGSTITSYLLEKTRVVGQAPNERNYHAFYQVNSRAAGARR